MSSQALPGHPRPLTFGIEYEFLVARAQGNSDPHPQDKRWIVGRRWTDPSGTMYNSYGVSVNAEAQDFIQSLLERHSIPALSSHRCGTSEYVWREMDRQGAGPPPNRVEPHMHAFWMVTNDPGIELIEEEDVDGYEFVDMEVASRILEEKDFYEVVKAYSLIRGNIRTQVNSSCGLHIHIGIRHLSLDSVKKLVTLVVLVEYKGLFAWICAPHRSSPDNEWCPPVSKRSRAILKKGSPLRDRRNTSLEDHLPQHHGISRDLHMALTRIWNCRTVDGIAEEVLTCDNRTGSGSEFKRRGGFALRGDLDGASEEDFVNADPTIEFRYKESTGSALEDYHFLQLCLHLVRGAEWTRDCFRATVRALSTSNTLDNILGGLGVGDNEVQWWLRIAERHRDHPNSSKNTHFLVSENFSSLDVA